MATVQDVPDLPSPIDEVPAAHLEGRTLPSGWTIGKRLTRTPGATGGQFSVQYNVINDDGHEAFLKALNIQPALRGPGRLVDRLAAFAQAHKFEAALLAECRDRRLSRIIRLLDDGQVRVPEAGVLEEVPYLILERADGDIRAFQATLAELNLVWALRTLNHVSLALEQLHTTKTAHQDLKPSNVLTQDEGRQMKVGDLGRAERQGIDGPVSDFQIPGAVAYAPPEQGYGAFSRTWEERRAGDIYLLGSLAAQLFVRHNFSTLLYQSLSPPHRTNRWTGGYTEVIPYLENAHASVITQLRREIGVHVPDERMLAELLSAISQLTQPNPKKRGHPRARRPGTSSYDVRRYVSLFNSPCEVRRDPFEAKLAAMSQPIDDSKRHVVPRWRPFGVSAGLSELDAFRKTAVLAAKPSPEEVHEAVQQWRRHRTPFHAADVVDIALLLDDPSVGTGAAEFLLSEGGSELSTHVARSLLTPVSLLQPEPQIDLEPADKYRRIAVAKRRLVLAPYDAITWIDIAREYSALGQYRPAMRAITSALSLAPDDRFVLRSASRFFLHLRDPEQARDILRREPTDTP